jgi:type II secretory pathway pseudopilin PulG
MMGRKRNFFFFTAFTLVELLAVVAILGLLIALLIPALSGARLSAKVVKAKAELSGIDTALGMYYDDFRIYPPSHTYCEYGGGDKAPDWAEIPPELARGKYLPTADAGSHLTASMVDPFNPDRTYKYLAPGRGYHNGSTTITGLWVPDNFNPGCSTGKIYTNQNDSPVKFALWSVGTYRDIGYWGALFYHHPLSATWWYSGWMQSGIIVRARAAGGESITSP